MSLFRTVSRASKGATCAIAMTFLAMSSADAQVTTVVDDSFADGITDSGALTAAGTPQLNWNVTSSGAALDLMQAPGPVDFASGNSSRGIHAIFPPQTLVNFGDVLTLTFTYTTPDTIGFDVDTNNPTPGVPNGSDDEDFRFGLYDTSGAIGMEDAFTMRPVDFTGPILSSSSTPNPPLAALAGWTGEIDNINQVISPAGVDPVTGETTPGIGTDLGIRTNNVEMNQCCGFASGRLYGSTSGFQFLQRGTDLVTILVPNTEYIGTLQVAFTDETLLTLDLTVGMEAVDGTFVDSVTRTVAIADIDPDPAQGEDGEVGVNTTTFDMFALGATSGAFGGTDGPVMGSSTVGEANNGIDISNVTITFEEASTALKGDVNLSGMVDFSDIAPFIAVLQGGMFQAEADCDCSTVVDFADIPAFIAILQAQ